jgi:hypothetical protein
LLQVCFWPKLHKHLREWYKNNTFRGVVIGDLEQDQLRPGTRSGTQQINERRGRGEEEVVRTVIRKIEDAAEYMFDGLGEVYSQKDIEMVENVRVVLDMKAKIEMVDKIGAVNAAQKTMRSFRQAADYIDPNLQVECTLPLLLLLLLVQVECDQLEWRQQYQEFWRKIAIVNEQKGSSEFYGLLLHNITNKRG